nr:transposase [Spinactinospora alkalitolerans]
MWAGVDIGKEHHHCVVIGPQGRRLLSRRVLNDEAELLELVGDVLALDDDVLWPVDLNHGEAALLTGLLLAHDQPVAYLTGYQTPAALRRLGTKRLETWLRARGVKGPAALAQTAAEAAQAQRTRLPGEKTAAAMVARLAGEVMRLNEEITETEALIQARFRDHRHAGLITSLPGMGALLGAEFLTATGGDMGMFGSADRLAGYAGLASAPRDSGKVSGNLRRPRRFHRGLLRAFYLSSMASLRSCPASKAYYDRKRAEGKGHKQALLALSHRRINVLWAMLRDGTPYQGSPPVTLAA